MPMFINLLFVINTIIFAVLYCRNTSTTALWSFVLILIVGLLLASIKLTITANKEYISWQIFPFHLNERQWTWNNLEELELIKISALADFGGWGLRYSSTYGWGYILSGEWGLRLVCSDGQKLVLSIRDKTKFHQFLKENQLL